eukprot:9552900-Alexandrium_andersonii.AAC.1
MERLETTPPLDASVTRMRRGEEATRTQRAGSVPQQGPEPKDAPGAGHVRCATGVLWGRGEEVRKARVVEPSLREDPSAGDAIRHPAPPHT